MCDSCWVGGEWGAYNLGGFCPKGGFVQGAYISGGL